MVYDVLIDSTFKRNRHNLELFSIILSCIGTGFSVAYFLLEAGTSNGYKYRHEYLSFFFRNYVQLSPGCSPSSVSPTRRLVKSFISKLYSKHTLYFVFDTPNALFLLRYHTHGSLGTEDSQEIYNTGFYESLTIDYLKYSCVLKHCFGI